MRAPVFVSAQSQLAGVEIDVFPTKGLNLRTTASRQYKQSDRRHCGTGHGTLPFDVIQDASEPRDFFRTEESFALAPLCGA